MTHPSRSVLALLIAFLIGVSFTSPGRAAPQNAAHRLTRDQAFAMLRPYVGDSAAGVDCSTLNGKIMCGYQGWFTTAGDDAHKGWAHYGSGRIFAPGHCCIDLWPDVSELAPDEKYPTPFHFADGSTADVFSSDNAKTVIRHFHWMQQYGIDGVFVQRFAGETFNPINVRHCNVVLNSCRQGANEYGRAYAVMYDLSGLGPGQIGRVMDDWKSLVDQMNLGHDPKDKAYLHDGGKPVVAVWGVGFSDGRKYSLDDCRALIDFLEHDPKYGGCTVMIGVPSYWRTLDRDAVADPALLSVIASADIVSPWSVGRYNSPKNARRFAEEHWKPDIEWCRSHGKQFLPVAFPGFSWRNMNPRSKLDAIPRLKGRFLWAQYVAAKKAGATMIYQAMFDEMNEGTAIFKCTNTPPVGASPFLTDEGLPSDYYLWLAGTGGKLIRGQIPPTEAIPAREK